MAIKPEANVDPNAVKAMHQKVSQMREDIGNVATKMKKSLDVLNTNGHRDRKFGELKTRVDESEVAMKSLMRFMESYATYLQQQEKILREYLDSKKL
jgi:hypothetical protein